MQTFGGDPGELDGEASGKQYWQGRLHLLHHDKQFNNEEDYNEDDDNKEKVKIDKSSATCSIASTFQSLMRTIVLP